jgi:hypothetical protein
MKRRTFVRVAVAALLAISDGTRISRTERAIAAVQAQSVESAPTRVAVRTAPPRESRANVEILDAFDRYFEPTILTIPESRELRSLSETICGHMNTEWVRRVRERNRLSNDRVETGTRLLLPACPFYSLGGTITVQSQDTVSGAALREIGQAGSATLERIADLNSTTPDALNTVSPGRTLKVHYRTAPVSFVLKSEFAKKADAVTATLENMSGVIGAGSDLNLTLVHEAQPTCDAVVPSEGYPIAPDEIAAVLEFNASIRPPARKATVGVIDTGIEETETRLFLAKGVDGTVGANMDKRYPGFPTTAGSYAHRAHGTHVAGLVLGGLQGTRLDELVRQRVQLRIINIVSRDVYPGPTGAPVETFSIPMTNLMEALSYARRDPPIPILSITVETTTLMNTFREAFATGDYLAVVAAGNSGRDIDIDPSYPASFRSDYPRRFLTVAATVPSGSLATFSNRGNGSVDIAAPGCEVRSLLPDRKRGPMTGSSQAAPLVAFTAALLYAEGLNLQEVRNRIRTSARTVPDLLESGLATGGMLDVAKALSIYEDLVTIDGTPVPLRGRVDRSFCLNVAGQCRPPTRLARLTRRGGQNIDGGWSWIKAADGEVVAREIKMPTSSLRLKPRGANDFTEIPFTKVADILFAVR